MAGTNDSDPNGNILPENKQTLLQNSSSKKQSKVLPRDRKITELSNAESEAPAADFVPRDGGWGWLVCFASFWTNGTIFGILNTFGVIFVELLKEFDTGQDGIAFKISWIGSLQISMTFFMSPVASILVDRFGIRSTAFVGAILATTGMLASSFVYRAEILYLTYGVLLGVGSSLVYTPSLVILGHYFSKHLGLVNGIVSSGSAVFTIALPFAIKQLIVISGLRSTMRYLSGLYALLIVFVFIWRPQYNAHHKELDHYFASSENVRDTCWGCYNWARKFLNVSIWKNKGYLVWAIALPIAFLGYFVPFVHIVQHTRDVFPNANGEILVMCLGGVSGLSRLICGKIADLKSVNRVRMQQFAFLVIGVCTSCIPFAKSFIGLVVITIVMGLCDGCFICLLGPIAFDLLGPLGAAQGIGCLLGLMSFPMTAGPPLAGLVYDYTKAYDLAFYAAGAPPILSALCLFLMRKSPQKHVPAVSTTQNHAYMSQLDLNMVGVEDTSNRLFSSQLGIMSTKPRGPREMLIYKQLQGAGLKPLSGGNVLLSEVQVTQSAPDLSIAGQKTNINQNGRFNIAPVPEP